MPVLLVPGNYPCGDDGKENNDGDGVIEETVGGLLPRSLGPEGFGVTGFVRGRED